MQRALDDMFKATGHQNAYFPLFIPQSFITREAEHVEGFAKEMAMVTHTRLIKAGRHGLSRIRTSKLEEPLVVRPTSETIIYAMFAKWVQSYRDLPLLINQWANVVRWEMRTRLFLRTLSSCGRRATRRTPRSGGGGGGACACSACTATSWRTGWRCRRARPEVGGGEVPGRRAHVRVEALMQDNRALQAGTSHMLGQNFARQFDLKFQTESGRRTTPGTRRGACRRGWSAGWS
jgi:prolyl-tRNA synthetase